MADPAGRFLEAFPAFAARRGPEAPAVAELRRRAIARFERLGLPSSRDEEWKHTPVARFLDRDFEAGFPAAPSAAPFALPELSPAAVRIVFIDGRLAGDADPAHRLPKGVHVGSLGAALANARDGVPHWLGRCADFETRSIAALNTAFMADGALVTIAHDVDVETPIHLIHVVSDAAAGRAVHLRHLVVAGPGSRATIVEHYLGGGAAAVVNAVTEIAVEAGAEIRHVKFQEEGPATVHLASVDALLARDGRFHHGHLAAGAAAGRTEARVKLAEVNAECWLAGVSLAFGEQFQDQLTRVDHAAPHGTSRQTYRGVFGDRAKGVFNGLVIVRPDAQQTNAEQQSRNLVLGDQAEVHARPQLDISADDVKCTHGATVGALDESALFYLRSRAIGPEAAKRLLVRAFAGEALGEFPEGDVRDYAERILAERLAR